MYKNNKVFVLGMARSGYEVAKFLLRHSNRVLVTDMKDQNPDHVDEILALGGKFVVSENPEELLNESYDLVVKNPGIHYEHKCVLKAQKLGINVITEMELIYNVLPKNVFIIGVTGSNGKTTTVSLIYEILKSANLPVHYGGNIGIPFASMYEKIKEHDILVMEISSHQLVNFVNFKCNIAVLTNISETHLDFFKNYDFYIQNKFKIFNHQTIDDIAIINYNNKETMELISKINAQKITFSLNENTDVTVKNNDIYYKDELVINVNNIRIKGYHNIENIMCAIAVVKNLKIDNEIIKEVLNKFSGVEHRMEFVKKFNNREFYNDSKSTNVIATQVALSSIDKPIILLLGGLDRGHSFDDLKDYLKITRYIITYGETKDRIKQFADSIKKNCVVVNNLEEAVKVGYNLSEEGDIILLSPACASWDQYSSFEERGEAFKKHVENLK